ncbi:uncharacterized protein [Diadema antillarum]|uniref:uncharacterized protein n=1 Tax=Diadema antillarum TaxID=105358 RepID=UPI003A8B3884
MATEIFFLLLSSLLASLVAESHAQTYAFNVSSTSIGSSTCVLTWLLPSDFSLADAYRITVADEASNVVINITIASVSTSTYTLRDLTFSTYHNATVATLDVGGSVVGSDYLYFLTRYDPWNFRALCAIGVVGGILLILIIVKAAIIIYKPDKKADKWRQEILVTKQREREERKKKMSSQPAVGEGDDLPV